MRPRPHRLVLMSNTIDEWCVARAEQARNLGCSEPYIKKLVADLRKRYTQIER